MTGELDALRDRLHSPVGFALLAPTYPRSWKHGGEFIRSRVQAYASAGLGGVVIDYSAPQNSRATLHETPSGPIAHVRPELLPEVVSLLAQSQFPVLAHSPTPELQDLLVASIEGSRVAVWFHGYEVRDHRRLYCNTSTRDAALLRKQRDTLNANRFAAARRLFAKEDLSVVFVSDFQRRISELDVGAPVSRSEIIPNYVDQSIYRGRVRRPEESRRILLMRGFNARNYGNDIATEALRLLSQRRGFRDLQITVRGFGVHFAENTNALAHLPNVEIQQRYSSPAEMACMHYDNGIFLCPTRWDTQGVMLGEAMASGMVAVTTPVAAIPEFTDARSSVLAKPEDPAAFAEAIWHLVENPELMPVVSEAAIRRVSEQCGRAATVEKEIELIGRLGA